MTDQHFQSGPTPFVQELDENTDELSALVARLIQADRVAKKWKIFEVPSGAQTDGSGNAKWVAWESPQGFESHLHRININAVNPTTGLPYTPTAPFTGGYFALYRGEVGLMSLIDFAPPSPGSNVFPQISTDGSEQAAIIRGERVIAVVQAGPINSQVGIVLRGRMIQL